MNFDETLQQVLALVQRQGRVSYRAIKRRFDVDDAFLEDLKEELLFTHRQIVDEDGRGLVWRNDADVVAEPAAASPLPVPQPVVPEDLSAAIASAAALPPPDAERRQLTVMFTDLVDSTTLSGQLDPEDYREVLRAYQSTCSGVIQRFDGYIAQHLGDALLVYFGFPQAHEDDAKRAIHTGLGMLAAMTTLNTRLAREQGIRLAIRVGIHTGLTIISDVGAGQKHEMLALGEAPNIASRIQSIAAPDTVAMSEATYRLVEGYFRCDDLGWHTLKGVAEPMQVYRVLRESGAQSRFDVAATRGLTPLVGRESEVTLLCERWHQVKDGQGQVLILSGEGGIGKSRLVQVLKDHVTGELHTRLECRSSPYFQNTALYPLIDLLQRTLQWQADDPSDEKLAKLERTLSQYRVSLAESVPLFAPLLSLPIPAGKYPPLPLSPQRQRQKTLEAIVALLLELSEQQPVLFILEDLHWTDPTTLEFLDLLIGQAPTASLLAVLTCRPTFQPNWGLQTHLTPIAVHRLNRSQIETMAERVAGGKTLPAEVRQHLVERTDGVPLFVEEMTKAVLESGVLKAADGQYALQGSMTSLSIPATLQDSLMARLDRLGTAKGLAQIGATIGRQFSYALLQAISQTEAALVQRELGKLVEAELLYQRGVLPQATYVFKHALIQDTAYQSLLRRTRQQIHAQIAQVLEAQFPETVEVQPELLAHHYTEAGLSDRAISYWQQAGQRAIEASAYVEGIAHLKRGLALLKPLPETPERIMQEIGLLTVLGPALMAVNGYRVPEVEHTYARAHVLCRELADMPQLLSILGGLWRFYFVRAAYHTARDVAGQLLHLAQHQNDAVHTIAGHWLVGTPAVWLGDIAVAHEHFEQARALYHPDQHRSLGMFYGFDPGLMSLPYSAMTLWALGYPEQALQRSHEAHTQARASHHPFTLTYTLLVLSLYHYFCRDGHLAQEYADALMTLATEHSYPIWLAFGPFVKGLALAVQGQAGHGATLMQQGRHAMHEGGIEMLQPCFLGQLADIHRIRGQIGDGLKALDDALALAHTNGERFYVSELHRLKGELLLHAVGGGRQTEVTAEMCFQRAIDIARQQQAKSWELRAATSLARLWQSQDKHRDAHNLLAPVYGWFTEGFDTADVQEARALQAELSQ